MKPDDLPALALARGAGAAGAGRHPRILIVDDDPGTVQALARILGGSGELRFACSGADALRLAREQPPDLVLLDVDMPAMNGFEVCLALKADPALAAAAVIFITSHGEPGYEVEALGVGAADFITKPPRAEQVLARVQVRLRSRSAGAPQAPAGSAQPRPAPVRLLLVDNDEATLEQRRATLAGLADSLQLARSGTEALAVMAQSPPDLVVAALQLPDLDGFALCRRLRADPRWCQAALLLVGPRADWRSEAQAFELGASDFMARPFPAAVLAARVRNLLRQRREALALRPARRNTWHSLGDARVAELLAAGPDPWLAVDADDCVVLANAAAGRALGVEAAVLLGQPLAACQARAGWPGTAARWPLGEGRSRITGLRLCTAARDGW